MKQVYEFLKKAEVYYLATIEGDQPRVRPFGTVDIFEGKLAPLMLVEVEFNSVEDANNFLPPNWFGEDVTNSNKYHNSYLSQHTE